MSKKPSTTPAPQLIDAHQSIWAAASELHPDESNLRGTLTDLDDLADSIAAIGIVEPLVVAPTSDTTGTDGPWRIIAGHRRHAAVLALIAAGRWPADRQLPCTVTRITDPETRVVAQLIENLQRVDLDPIDEANGYRRLVEHGWTNTRIGQATGRHKDRVAGRLKLLNLPDQWQTDLRAGVITLDHAAKLAAAPKEVIDQLAKRSTRAPHIESLDGAVWEHKVVKARSTVKQTCTARGITFIDKSGWHLERDHDRITTTTPTELATVLLPERTDLKATMVSYYQGMRFEVWVYAPTAPDGVAAPVEVPVELSPLQEWQQQCTLLTREHQAATAAWKKTCSEFLSSWAPTVSAQHVADAAIWDAIQAYEDDLEQVAEHVGWNPPPPDADVTDSAWAAWFEVPRNRTATLALFFADMAGDNPVAVAARAALDQAGLTAPTLDLPPRPANDLDDDDGEPDENAHLYTDDADDDDDFAVEGVEDGDLE